MDQLAPVERVEVQVLVDNATDFLSTTPGHVESEGAGLLRPRANRAGRGTNPGREKERAAFSPV